MNWIWMLVGAVGSSVLGYINRVYDLLFTTIRLDEQSAARFYSYLKQQQCWRFVLYESYHNKPVPIPDIECSWWWHALPFSLTLSEKYLTAGSNPKEQQCVICAPRFYKSKLIELLRHSCRIEEERDHVSVYVNRYSWFQRVNDLRKSKYQDSVCLSHDVETQLNQIVHDFQSGTREKSGILLYGPPGNGKTSIIRSVACRYDYDIYIPIFRSDDDNSQILSMFANIPSDEKAIIVLEDFDSVFDNRKPLYANCKFSFDMFLNILDGLYISLEKKLIFITANDVDKIDKALKNRPSRCDYILKIDNPDYDSRLKILHRFNLNGSSKLIADQTDGLSAAMVSEIARRHRHFGNNDICEEVKTIVDAFSVAEVETKKEDDAKTGKKSTDQIFTIDAVQDSNGVFHLTN